VSNAPDRYVPYTIELLASENMPTLTLGMGIPSELHGVFEIRKNSERIGILDMWPDRSNYRSRDSRLLIKLEKDPGLLSEIQPFIDAIKEKFPEIRVDLQLP